MTHPEHSKAKEKRFCYLEDIEFICTSVRKFIVEKYSESLLGGKCIEASEMISQKLQSLNIKHKIVEGWCTYDLDSGYSDRPYDEHTWVEIGDLYVDVTATQFSMFIDEEIPDIIVGEKPGYMVYEEPDVLDDDDD